MFLYLSSLTRWHDVCLNMPCAIQEVLYAWEHGAIKQETVQVGNATNKMNYINKLSIIKWMQEDVVVLTFLLHLYVNISKTSLLSCDGYKYRCTVWLDYSGVQYIVEVEITNYLDWRYEDDDDWCFTATFVHMVA